MYLGFGSQYRIFTIFRNSFYLHGIVIKSSLAMEKTFKPFTNIDSYLIWIVESSSSLHFISDPFALVSTTVVEFECSITFPYISNHLPCIYSFWIKTPLNFFLKKTILIGCFVFIPRKIVWHLTWFHISLSRWRDLCCVAIFSRHKCVPWKPY